MNKITGIYKIVNKINGKFYVGSSKNIHKRWRRHIRCLNDNNHHNDHLQRSWNKYGIHGFDFMIMEECSPERLLDIEQKYLNVIKDKKKMSYNNNYKSNGGEISESARKKISKFRKTFKYSEESKLKISRSLRGRKLSPSHREKEVEILNRIRRQDLTVYSFVHWNGESFTGTQNEFVKKYALHQGNVYHLVKNKPRVIRGISTFIRSVKGWKVLD